MNENPRLTTAPLVEPVDPDIDFSSPSQRAEASRHPGTLPVIVLGGMLGACGRHGVEVGWPTHPAGFPWATFATNVSGSLLLGLLMVVVLETSAAHPLLRPFLGVGVIGGYTTFSTYAVQTRDLLVSDSHPGLAMAYMFGTLVATLAAVAVGLTAARLVAHRHWYRPISRSGPSASTTDEVS